MDDYSPDTKEQQRVVVAIAILATVVALYTLPIASKDIWSLSRGLTLLPGVFAFGFILMTGSHLKYKNPGTIGDLNIAHSVRKFFYNWMIDGFSSSLLISIMFFAAAGLGWDGTDIKGYSLWVGFGIGAFIFLSLSLLSIIAWNKEQRSLVVKK